MRDVGRLHLITDVTLQDRLSHVDLARIASEAKVDVVQFRHKEQADFSWRVEIARQMHDLLRASGGRLVINDHPRVAAAVGIKSVHLGEGDPSPQAARERLGHGALIGVTVNDLSQARASRALEIDYVGVGPVFGTRSKSNPTAELGLRGLREIVAAVGVPVVAIGNIRAENVKSLFECGVHGVAVLSAIVCAEDPAREIRSFQAAIAEASLLGAER